jgi:hypothetical protein
VIKTKSLSAYLAGISAIAFGGAGSIWLTLGRMQRLPGVAGDPIPRPPRLARD